MDPQEQELLQYEEKPTPKKSRTVLAGFLALVIVGLGSFLIFSSGSQNSAPPEVPQAASGTYQGKLTKDALGILQKEKSDNKGAIKYKSAKKKTLKAGPFHYGIFENTTNMQEVIDQTDVLVDNTKLLYLTYDPTINKWVTTPEKVYIGTKSIETDKMKDYNLIGGGLITSTKDVTVYNFNQGETPAKSFDCSDHKKGWQITLAPKTKNNDYTFYKDCVPSSIWEYDPTSTNNKAPFKKIPVTNLNTKIGSYLHWVNYSGLTKQPVVNQQPEAVIKVTNEKTPASQKIPAGTKKALFSNLTIESDQEITITSIILGNTGSVDDVNNITAKLGNVDGLTTTLEKTKRGEIEVKTKLNAGEKISLEIKADVSDIAKDGSEHELGILAINYLNKDGKDYTADKGFIFGKKMTISNPVVETGLVVKNTNTPGAAEHLPGDTILFTSLTIEPKEEIIITDIIIGRKGTGKYDDLEKLDLDLGKSLITFTPKLAQTDRAAISTKRVLKANKAETVDITATIAKKAKKDTTQQLGLLSISYTDSKGKSQVANLQNSAEAFGEVMRIGGEDPKPFNVEFSNANPNPQALLIEQGQKKRFFAEWNLEIKDNKKAVIEEVLVKDDQLPFLQDLKNMTVEIDGQEFDKAVKFSPDGMALFKGDLSIQGPDQTFIRLYGDIDANAQSDPANGLHHLTLDAVAFKTPEAVFVDKGLAPQMVEIVPPQQVKIGTKVNKSNKNLTVLSDDVVVSDEFELTFNFFDKETTAEVELKEVTLTLNGATNTDFDSLILDWSDRPFTKVKGKNLPNNEVKFTFSKPIKFSNQDTTKLNFTIIADTANGIKHDQNFSFVVADIKHLDTNKNALIFPQDANSFPVSTDTTKVVKNVPFPSPTNFTVNGNKDHLVFFWQHPQDKTKKVTKYELYYTSTKPNSNKKTLNNGISSGATAEEYKLGVPPDTYNFELVAVYANGSSKPATYQLEVK